MPWHNSLLVAKSVSVSMGYMDEEPEVQVKVENEEGKDDTERGDEAATSDCVETCVMDMSKEELGRLTMGAALRMFTRRAGVPHDVEGNGTCWMYAVLAAMRILEHGWTTPSCRQRPTTLDINFSEALLKAMRTHFRSWPEPRPPGRYQRDASLYDDYKKIEERLGRQNVWVPSMGKNMALFGSESMLTLLARTLERSIIVLNGETMNSMRLRPGDAGLQREGKVHQVHDPFSKRLYRRDVNTAGALIHLETHEDSFVLVHVNGNHYHGYALKGVAPDQLPPCLAKAKGSLASR